MILQHVPFYQLSLEHLRLLALAVEPVPEWIRPMTAEITQELKAGRQQLYSFPNGVILLSKQEGKGEARLLIDAFVCERGYGNIVRSLVTDLRKLASEWSCDRIETTCFAKPLLQIITKLGGKIESVTVTLEK